MRFRRAMDRRSAAARRSTAHRSGRYPARARQGFRGAGRALRNSSSSGCAIRRSPNASPRRRFAPKPGRGNPRAKRRRAVRPGIRRSRASPTRRCRRRPSTGLCRSAKSAEVRPARCLSEAQQVFGEFDLQLAHQHPWPQRPGRVILVRYVKLVHRPLRIGALRGGHFKGRRPVHARSRDSEAQWPPR